LGLAAESDSPEGTSRDPDPYGLGCSVVASSDMPRS
jgi:hypothetical protein